MRFLLLSVILLQLSCSPPSRQCESQFDCFGSEVCIDGECMKQIVMAADMAQTGGDMTVASDTSARDSDQQQPDLPSNNLPDVADMQGDAGACDPPCQDGEICAGFGSCVVASADIVWTLDDVEVARHRTAEGLYYAATDSLYIAMPFWGRNVTITVEDVGSTAPFSATCADFQNTGFALSLITSDNSWADLDALPATWKGLIATDSSCAGGLVDGDMLQRWDIEMTTLSSTSAAGTVDIEISGGGPRSSETLRISGSFDVMLEQM